MPLTCRAVDKQPGKRTTSLSRDEVTIGIMLFSQAAALFAAFCPSWFTVRSPFFHEQESVDGNRLSIRAGEVAATALVMSTGWAVGARSGARTTRKNIPLLISAAISAIFVAGYEACIAHPATEDTIKFGINTDIDNERQIINEYAESCA